MVGSCHSAKSCLCCNIFEALAAQRRQDSLHELFAMEQTSDSLEASGTCQTCNIEKHPHIDWPRRPGLNLQGWLKNKF